MKKFIPLLVLCMVFSLSIGQNLTYLGNNILKNFSINLENKSDTILQLNLAQGQILVSQDGEFADFVLAKGYNFLVDAKSSTTEKVMAYSIKNIVFPDSGSKFQLLSQKMVQAQEILKQCESQNLWGNKAQFTLWNKLDGRETFDVEKKYIYTYNERMIYESNRAAQLIVLAEIDTIALDTLLENKSVGVGEYSLNLHKNVFSDIKGTKEILILDITGKVLFDTGDRTELADTHTVFYTFNFECDRPYLKSDLEVFNTQNKKISTLYTFDKIESGRTIEAYSFDYFGLSTDTLHIRLSSKKGKVVFEDFTSVLQSNANLVGSKEGDKYLKIKHKYTSKKYENRAMCIIEDITGKRLATIFENRNIHSGINKIEYNFKHNLEEGDTVFLIVKLPSGKIIEKKAMQIID